MSATARADDARTDDRWARSVQTDPGEVILDVPFPFWWVRLATTCVPDLRVHRLSKSLRFWTPKPLPAAWFKRGKTRHMSFRRPGPGRTQDAHTQHIPSRGSCWAEGRHKFLMSLAWRTAFHHVSVPGRGRVQVAKVLRRAIIWIVWSASNGTALTLCYANFAECIISSADLSGLSVERLVFKAPPKKRS